MLAEGQVTSSTTPSQSKAAKEWMHFPGQLSTSAVLVTDPNKPEGGIQYVILYHSTEEGRLKGKLFIVENLSKRCFFVKKLFIFSGPF